jgi:hypothetical protein
MKKNSKYERGLDIVEIAKRLRAEIKAAIKVGTLPAVKYSVRVERFSGGKALDVTIKDYPGEIHNRRRIELEQEVNKGSAAIGKDRYADLYTEYEQTPYMTDEAIRLIKVLEALANQWNFDDSDSQTDYFHVNYYLHVAFDSEQSHAEYMRMKAEVQGRIDQGKLVLRIFDPDAA